jgi:hypothetical protein
LTAHDSPTSKADLLERIETAQAELDAALLGLSNAQLDRKDRDGGWSIKDHVGHIIGWRGHALAALQGDLAHEGMGIAREQFANLHVDEVNDLLYAQHRDRPPEEVLAEMRAQHQRLVELIDGMSDEDLQRPYQSERSTSPRSLIDQVAFTMVRHTRAHLDDIRRLAGEG